jgi:hypothetical protein
MRKSLPLILLTSLIGACCSQRAGLVKHVVPVGFSGPMAIVEAGDVVGGAGLPMADSTEELVWEDNGVLLMRDWERVSRGKNHRFEDAAGTLAIGQSLGSSVHGSGDHSVHVFWLYCGPEQDAQKFMWSGVSTKGEWLKRHRVPMPD